MIIREIVLIIAALAPAAAAEPRVEVSLNGSWQYRLVQELADPPSVGSWQTCRVPGYLRGHDYQRVWLRRSFDVPASIRGKRIKIHFGGVKYNSRVLMNGRQVGGCFGGYRPFEVDVTDAVRFDGPNELLVGCHDWTGLFTPGRIDFSQTKGDWNKLRHFPRDKILAPIGGLYALYGIWGDVTLRACPAVYVKDLFIRPSVRRGELTVEYTLANESTADAEVRLGAVVEQTADGKVRDILDLGPATVSVPAGKEATATLRRPWPDPRLWSHVDPYLYHLRTELSTGDRQRTRFGFREFWTEGHRFYLNGTRINLLATSWWPPHAPMTREEIRRRWEAIKRCGCVAFRTHTQPWRSVHYDVADELGLLMIVEGAVWNDDYVYRVNDPVFWENYAGHLEAMVDRDKNRPSVVMWSLENEFHGGRVNDNTPAKAELARMGRLVKKRDPTRPIYYESDGDPEGVADVVGIHYPHEYPRYTCWPNEAWWLGRPQKIGHRFFNGGRDDFLWDRKKPLYIGEFLWLPSSDPSWHTVFFGDEAYRDYRRYRDLAKAASWRMQILGYRHFEVGGISPWTVVEGGRLDESNPLYRAHQFGYEPVAAYCHDYDWRFFAGEAVQRRVEVFNDLPERSELKLQWTLTVGDEVVGRGQQRLELGPADHRMLDVVLPMPEVPRRTEAAWRVSLVRNGRTAFAQTHKLSVFPQRKKSEIAASRMGLYDTDGSTRRALAAMGLSPVDVSSLAAVPDGVEVLILGAGSLAEEEEAEPVIGQLAPERVGLDKFLARGGRLLVLHQEACPAGLFDVALDDHRSTMTFAARAGHPALAGVLPRDLKFWRGDHLVTGGEAVRPSGGGALPVVVSGSAAGLNHAPLLECPTGRGCTVFAQMKLIEKLESEPIAGQILGNLLSYLADYEPRQRKTALAGGTPAYRDYLRSLGLRFDDLTGKLSGADLSGYRLLVCRDETADPQRLVEFVQRGGNLLVHRPSADGLDRLAKAFDLDLVAQPYTGPVSRAEGTGSMIDRFLREDLYWLGPHTGIAWSQTPRAGEMADGIFSKTLAGKDAQSHEIEDWQLEGKIVERRTPGVAFATAGRATAEIDFPASGQYVIGLVGRGTPCEGVYPRVEVAVDGRPLGTVGGLGDRWRTVTTFGRVEKGRHKLSVAFVNDASRPPVEDRNLFVDKILIAADDGRSAATFLTSPPAVALFMFARPKGPAMPTREPASAGLPMVAPGSFAAQQSIVSRGQGTLVIDRLRWDSEEDNSQKAARLAGTLLTDLGGEFTPRAGTRIDCASMTPQPGMAHFENQGSHVSLACNGWVMTPVRVAAAGRYTLKLTASGTSCQEVYPHVEVRLDGRIIGQVQMDSGNWRSYWIDVDLPAGQHELALAFVNDLNRDGEDRNLRLQQVVFYRQ